MSQDVWNKCQDCGRFISYDDLLDGKAVHRMLEPDSEFGGEKWETLCGNHYAPPPPGEPS